MTSIDVGILALLCAPAFIGLVYGVLNILCSVGAWALATFTAIKLSGFFSPMLAGHLDSMLREVVAFIGVFLVSLIAFSAMGYVLVTLYNRMRLTLVDRFLGMLLGLGLGAVIVTTLVFLAGFTAMTQRDWWRESTLVEPFQRVCVWGQRLLPADVSAYHRYENGGE